MEELYQHANKAIQTLFAKADTLGIHVPSHVVVYDPKSARTACNALCVLSYNSAFRVRRSSLTGCVYREDSDILALAESSWLMARALDYLTRTPPPRLFSDGSWQRSLLAQIRRAEIASRG